MIDETTLDKLLELVKVDCPRDKSWSVAVRTYAAAQRLFMNLPEPERHEQSYNKVKQYYEIKDR